MDIKPAFKISGKVAGTYCAQGASFITSAVPELEMDFEGILDDFHRGHTRMSGGREPWYPRGTQMRNERQVSLLSVEELDFIAASLGLSKLKPEWIGANLVVEGVPNFTQLPPRTLLFFEGGVTLKIDGDNAPCRIAGKEIAQATSNPDHEFEFPKQAQGKRGLVAWVEKAGVIKADENFKAHIPAQWIY